MHIAIDASRAIRARRTGTETYARQIIERLVQRHPEVRWTLFFQDDPGAWLNEVSQVERVILPQPRLWTYRALAPALLRLRPDAFWEPAHVLPPTAPLAAIPSLVTVHDLGYEYFPQAHPPRQRAYLRLTTRYHAHAATHIAADSAATQRDLVALYGADPERITVVAPGVDHTTFRPVTDAQLLDAVRERYGTGERFLLYVGTLQPRKNLPRLVRAFAPLARDFPDLRLVLAGGQGWLNDEVEQAIVACGVAGRVVRPGYVADEDLPALLSAAEALAFPSLFEGFGLPVLEAMACGTPVLTSNRSSLPEVAGEAAILVPPTEERAISEGLRLLLTQPALHTALRERGLAQAARFTWERSAEQIAALLLSMAQPRHTTILPVSHPHPAPATISLLGLPIHNLSWEETMAEVARMVETRHPHQLVTVNPEFLMRAQQDAPFMAVLRRADLVLADGVGLLLAARWHGKRFQARITGSDMTPMLAEEAARRGWRLYLLGAAPGVAECAAAELRSRHPGLEVIADGSDPTPDGPPALLERIRQAKADILLVAYGAPKQDLWIDSFGKQTGVPVQMGVGGALDFIAGVVPRAPERWQRLNLEWLWRLKEEPWRWRRMLALPRFALAAAWEAAYNRRPNEG